MSSESGAQSRASFETKIFDSILDVVGNTPIVTLRKIPLNSKTRIYLKLESFNPSGSLKDRIYKKMISKAISSGRLKPGMEILEASTGNAGIACTYVGTLMGYRVTIIMPEGMSEERKELIRAYGGNILATPGAESDVDLCLAKIQELITRSPDKYWFPDQFGNSDNPLAHYEGTGPELWTQTGGSVDCFIAAQGSGGTLTGVGKYLRERKGKDVKLFAVEPSEAPILARSKWGTHKIEGIGDGFVPRNLDLALLDGVVTVSSDEAIEMTRRLLREEGIFCGISSGCNVAAALKIVAKHPELRAVVTMINDSGNRYLSTEVFGRKKKEVQIPDREHPIDKYTSSQLAKYQPKFEVID